MLSLRAVEGAGRGIEGAGRHIAASLEIPIPSLLLAWTYLPRSAILDCDLTSLCGLGLRDLDREDPIEESGFDALLVDPTGEDEGAAEATDRKSTRLHYSH